MKARLLRAILNNTEYTIGDYGKYIAVGSPLCHNLISVDKATLDMKYALDTFREGRKALGGKGELLFIWDKLHEIIGTGQIKEVIGGDDEISPRLPVYSVKDGQVIESFTDAYGWPNTTHAGQVMYENTHFKTKREAIQKGIAECLSGLEMFGERLEEIKKDEERIKSYIEREATHLHQLQSLP